MTTSSSGSNWTYRTETNPLHSTVVTDHHSSIDNVGRFSGGGGGGFHNDLLERQLEQARQQRTGFYRRLADVGRRGTPSAVSSVHTESLAPAGGASRRAELLNGAGRRKRQSETTTGSESVETHVNDVIRGINDPLVFTDMEAAERSKPQTSWRYYTSYDKDSGEWRRHAAPVLKADEDETETVTVENSTTDNSSRRSRPSTFDRISRLRGGASLLHSAEDLKPLGDRRARSEDITMSYGTSTGLADELNDYPYHFSTRNSGIPYGGHDDVRPYVDDVMHRILGDSWRRTADTDDEEHVIYANTSRSTICDDSVPTEKSTIEIPEGNDESTFVEKTLAPSGRPWVSAPSLSERIMMMSVAPEEGDGGDDVTMSDSKRDAVFSWLTGSADGDAATVLPFGADSSTGASSRLLAPGKSETTIRAETRTTVETVGSKGVESLTAGQNGHILTARTAPSTFNGNSGDAVTIDESSTNHSEQFGMARAEDGRLKSSFSHSDTAAKGIVTHMPDGRIEHDVIWIPVIHVPDPASVGDQNGGVADVSGREASSPQRIITAKSWSTQVHDANARDQEASSDGIVGATKNISSSIIVKPTAVVPSSNGTAAHHHSAQSPTTDVSTFSSSISLHTGDKPFTGRTAGAAVITGDAGSGRCSTGSTKSSSEMQTVGNGECGGFRSVASAAGTAENVISGATTGDCRGAGSRSGSSSANVFRSETCFSVDAVKSTDSDHSRDAGGGSSSVFESSGSKMWKTPVVATLKVQPGKSSASQISSTVWNPTVSTSWQSSKGVDYTKRVNADDDDDDWVVEKAL